MIQLYITGKEKDLGGFQVRRVLPFATHRMVGPFIFFDHMGPFIFFDHMGPATLAPGQGLNVRPHPHIGLATVTYLFEGRIHHRDSLGSDQVIAPGDVNWMTAGRGIVHSERSPEDVVLNGGKEHGIQCWVALPVEFEATEPTFVHHESAKLPQFKVGGTEIKLLIGSAFAKTSPVKTHSDLFYFEAKLPAGEEFKFDSGAFEAAFYVVQGEVECEGRKVEAGTMAVAQSGQEIRVRAQADAHLMFLGGAPVGERLLDWNFVASTKERLLQARREWEGGPKAGSRFLPVPGDDREFIPIPPMPGAKGTLL